MCINYNVNQATSISVHLPSHEVKVSSSSTAIACVSAGNPGHCDTNAIEPIACVLSVVKYLRMLYRVMGSITVFFL